jgi:hypothetical protein
MKLTDILEAGDDVDKYAKNRELSNKFVALIKKYTKGQVDLKGDDANDMTEQFLFREPGGRNFGYWCAYGVFKENGYDAIADEDDDEEFIATMKELGFSTGECLYILHQRDH